MVGLFYPNDGWILERCGRELLACPGVIPGKPSEVNYYINYPLLYDSTHTASIDVALFDHREVGPPYREVFAAAARRADHCVAMSKGSARELVELGVDPTSISVIHMGVDIEARRPLRFGVVGRTYRSGRKGEFLVEEMLRDGCDVVAYGPQDSWDARGPQWPCRNFVGEIDTFYEQIDYLVVTSTNEGGPVPVLNALARGVPVIAPDIGWCWEYSVLRYVKGDWGSLRGVIHGLTPPTWKDWVDGHEQLFRRLGPGIPKP